MYTRFENPHINYNKIMCYVASFTSIYNSVYMALHLYFMFNLGTIPFIRHTSIAIFLIESKCIIRNYLIIV